LAKVILYDKTRKKMTVYDEFVEAWVDRTLCGGSASRLAAARARMQIDPTYDEAKYHQAVLRAQRIKSALIGVSLAEA
jgi:hypothetical protein